MGVDFSTQPCEHHQARENTDNNSNSNNNNKMLLMQDRVLGETMMQLVPSCSSHPLSTFDSEVSQLEFDLDLLPSLTDCKSVKSPGSPYSPACRGERRVSTQSNQSLGLQDHVDC